MKTITITDRTQIEDIIRKCPYCTVGMTDEEGNPYVVPMNFAWENDTVYLHSGPEGGKWKWRHVIRKSASTSVRGTNWCICISRWHAVTV